MPCFHASGWKVTIPETFCLPVLVPEEEEWTVREETSLPEGLGRTDTPGTPPGPSGPAWAPSPSLGSSYPHTWEPGQRMQQFSTMNRTFNLPSGSKSTQENGVSSPGPPQVPEGWQAWSAWHTDG